MSQEKETPKKFHKTREDKELEKVIALENKIKVAIDDNLGFNVNDPESDEMHSINADLEKFHLCLKEEMVVDLRYFNSLEHEVDSLKSQLETQKTQFLNEIDRLFREYYYADHMNAILGVYTTLDEFTDLQSLQQHAINLELALQQCQEQIKNYKAFKENQSKVFLKEREQYFEIQDLKAQLQDKGIAISELKKLIEKMKGKSVETKFENPSVIRQPNAFKSQRQSVLGKPATFSDSLAKTDFSKSKSVTTNNVSNDFSKPVTAQIFPQNVKSILKNTHVIALGMYKVHTKPNQTRTPQLPQDIRRTNKHVSFSTRVIPTTSVSRPHLKSNRLEYRVMHNNSKGKKQQVEDHRNESRTVDILEPMAPRCSTLSNAPLSSNSFSARRDNSIHRRLWVLKAHNRKSQASKSGSRESNYQEGLLRGRAESQFILCSRGTDLYSITLQDASTPNPICLMAKATSSQAWLWHSRLSHLNLDTVNLLSNYDIVTGLPKLKSVKDHLCSSCELGKTKRYSTQSRAYMVYNKRTRVIVEIIHVNFNELPHMASDHVSSDPILQCRTMALEQGSLSPGPQSQENVPHSAETVTASNELDLLFSLMFDELLNGTTQVVSKSFAVTTADAPNQRQQQHTTPSTSTTVVADTPPLNIQITPETTSQAPTVIANENIIQAETNKEYAQVEEDEFINIFSTPVQERGETSSRYVDSSNMHTFYQRHPLEHRWTKDHPLKHVIGNPSQSIRTRR
ncbi:integrase, catalytic region, zinc finger, CCHC-type containing protein [Tanacetum coccineum]